MAKIDTRRPRLGAVLQYEELKEYGFCRKVIEVTEASEVEYVAGTVIGATNAIIVAGGTFQGIYLGSPSGDHYQTIPAATATKVVIAYRGDIVVGKANLKFGANVDTDPEKDAIYAQMETARIHVIDQV